MHYYSPAERGRWPSRTWRPGGIGLDLRPPRIISTTSKLSGSRVKRKAGLNKTEAGDLMDWLESSGCNRFELVYSGSDGFDVCWWD
jgi:hypothetical protein